MRTQNFELRMHDGQDVPPARFLNRSVLVKAPSGVGRSVGLIFTAAVVTNCSEPRASRTGDPAWTTYRDVAPQLVQQCGGCHSGATGQGGYSIDSYLAAASRRDDGTPRAEPGNADALLLRAARGELPGPHAQVPDADFARLTDWVVRSRVAKEQYTFHFKGWMDPADTEQFHGLVLRQNGYRSDDPAYDCQHCHGADLRGGTSGVDCNSCHSAGVTACNTCHGDAASPAPPRDLHGHRAVSFASVGVHRTHVLPGPLHPPYRCSVCHPVAPTPDHYARYASAGEPPASIALLGAPPVLVGRWDRDSATCSNTYCHSPLSSTDPRATNPTPNWTRMGTGEAACGTCHGIPPATHPQPPQGLDLATAIPLCGACHRATVVGGQLVPAAHASGIGPGDPAGGCSGCHGDATLPAPPRDTRGRTDERFPSVGAHRAHLEARHKLRGPIACTECHQVPSAVNEPGHVDHPLPAIVFPNLAGVGTLARTDGAQPAYNATNATCGSVYCHGNGARLLDRDHTPNLIRAPDWTAGTSQVACGAACHGLPPRNPLDPQDPHRAVTNISECVNCHRGTVDAQGAIIVMPDGQSTHIDGIVEVGR